MRRDQAFAAITKLLSPEDLDTIQRFSATSRFPPTDGSQPGSVRIALGSDRAARTALHQARTAP